MSSHACTPHNNLYQALMVDKRIVQDLLEHYLPASLIEQLALDQVSVEKGSFIDEDLRASASDVLYRVGIKDSDQIGYLYVLAEHQSTPDRLMPFRLIKYTCRILDQFLAQHPNASVLPIVFPMVFYNGQRPYGYSMDFLDLFGPQRELAQSIYAHPFSLIDWSQIPDEELKTHYWSGLMEMLMKHASRGRTEWLIETIVEAFENIFSADTTAYLTIALKYILECEQKMPASEVLKLFNTSKKTEEKMASAMQKLAQQFKEEGILLGREEGLEKGRAEMIRRLLAKLGDVAQVAAFMDLEIQAVERILKEPHN